MKAIGKFVYKGLEKRDGGEFTNEKGQVIKYGEKYVLKVDEDNEGVINERKLSIDTANVGLIDRLKALKPYEKIQLECDVVLYNSSAKVIPVAIIDSNNK